MACVIFPAVKKFKRFKLCYRAFVLLFLASAGVSVRVLTLQDDVWSAPTSDVYVKFELNLLQETPVSTHTFSVCYRALVSSLSHQVVHLSYATGRFINGISIYFEGKQLYIYYKSSKQIQVAEFERSPRMREWTHYCHLFSAGKYSLYINGELSFETYIDSQDLVVNFNGTVILGQEQDEVEGGFVETEIFRGKLSQYNIWSERISVAQVVDMALCRKEYFGDILSMDVHDGVLNGARVANVGVSELCRDTLSFTVFTIKLTFMAARAFCRRTGSVMHAPVTEEENEEIFVGGQAFLDACLYFLWIDVSDSAEEGKWRRSSGEDVSLTFFENPGANNLDMNCASMQKQKSTWYVVSCEVGEKRCFPCEETGSSFLILRGLCFSDELKRSFEVIGYRNAKPFFHGLYGYNIYFSPPDQWALQDVGENETLAILNVSSEDVFPIGLHAWQLKRPLCEQAEGSVRYLGLSVCDDYQFMCSNGDCVPRQTRCDGHDDCSDKSDEEECGTLVVERNYRRHKPPQNDSKGETLLLRANVTFVRFLNIEDTKNAITIEFVVTLHWQDSRLRYTNLESTFSQISENERSKVWVPTLEFPNVESGEVQRLGETVFVKKTGKPLPPDINEAKMDTIYPSTSGLLVHHQRFTGKFSCILNMFYYPFDTQRCHLPIQLSSVGKAFVAFENATVNYEGTAILASYTVYGFRSSVSGPGDRTPNAYIRVEFLLTRLPVTVVLSVFIPTTMLLAIGYSTLHVGIPLMQVRMTVSLTTLLVLYTLFSQTSSSLPSTAYVKMIDVWFFFCICILFVIILFHVFVDKIRPPVTRKVVSVMEVGQQMPRKMTPERAMEIMRVYVVPLCMLTYLVIYWSVFVHGILQSRS